MGFYNLDADHQDRYNSEQTHQEEADLYHKTIKRHWRHSEALQPLQNETLSQYVQRMTVTVKELTTISDAHIYGRKVWWTHSSPSPCWICDLRDFVNIIHQILLESDKLHLLTATFVYNEKSSLLELKNKRK